MKFTNSWPPSLRIFKFAIAEWDHECLSRKRCVLHLWHDLKTLLTSRCYVVQVTQRVGPSSTRPQVVSAVTTAGTAEAVRPQQRTLAPSTTRDSNARKQEGRPGPGPHRPPPRLWTYLRTGRTTTGQYKQFTYPLRHFDIVTFKNNGYWRSNTFSVHFELTNSVVKLWFLRQINTFCPTRLIWGSALKKL